MAVVDWLLLGAALWGVAAGGALLAVWLALVRNWREPVFVCPLLLLDSDDWGAGPLSQASALHGIVGILRRYRDGAGRYPTMTLALVLAVPDASRIAGSDRYWPLRLDDPVFTPIFAALEAGTRCGVLSLQLHGMEHYWPETLMQCGDPLVAGWLRSAAPAATEQLPSHLQSRWTNSLSLPSRSHSAMEIRRAAGDEVREFQHLLGRRPELVVPPTFVWTREVERGWVAAGIQFVVTPGWRSTRRNAKGSPDGDEGPIVNGDRADGLTYLVRTDYFEPARGRDAAHALRALSKAAAEGRPCLLENHRDNFIFDDEQCRRSLAELDALFAGALRRHPNLRFLSTVELGRILRTRDPQWIVQRWRERLPFVWQRLRHSGRPWKLMKLTGLAALGAVLVRLLSRRISAGPPAAAS